MASQGKKRIVIGNWKMYIDSREEALGLARSLKRRSRSFPGVDIALAPAFVHIPALSGALKGSSLRLGAQSVSGEAGGAHTGEVSATMLKDAGASFVIVGHSECRARGESDERVTESLLRAEEANLRAVLCVGEAQRDESGAHFSFLKEQLKRALLPLPKMVVHKMLTIAYEPIWAIGKSAADAMKPREVRETVIFIRKTLSEMMGQETALKIPILYGGSVEGENARPLIEEGEVAGFLVGHASASLPSFLPILEACKK